MVKHLAQVQAIVTPRSRSSCLTVHPKGESERRHTEALCFCSQLSNSRSRVCHQVLRMEGGQRADSTCNHLMIHNSITRKAVVPLPPSMVSSTCALLAWHRTVAGRVRLRPIAPGCIKYGCPYLRDEASPFSTGSAGDRAARCQRPRIFVRAGVLASALF